MLVQVCCVSCSKDDKVDNALIGTEWSDNTGTWLFAFKPNEQIELLYTIQMGHSQTFKFKIPYKKEGNSLMIEDQSTRTPHGEFNIIKNFKGTITNSEIQCDFLTSSVEGSKEGGMPDFSKTVSKKIVLKKKM